MDRRDLMQAALAPAGEEPYTPVMVQKLFFLIDEEIPTEVGGPHFNFQPYDYGPYDSEVYAELENLAGEGLIEIKVGKNWSRRIFKLTSEGALQGSELLEDCNPKVQSFLKESSEFVRSLSFSQLVAAVYNSYGHMRANSVFQR